MRVGVVGLGRVGVVHARNAAQHPDVDGVLLLGRDDSRLAVGRDAVVAAGAEPGGIWRDLAVHDLDLLPWLLGDPVVAVTAFAAVLEQPELAALGDHDTATAVLQHASGALSTVTAARSNGAGQDVRLEVSGSRASASLSADTGVAPPYADFTERFAASFRAELDHVLRQARGEAEPLTPPSAGVAALRLAVAAEESVLTGRTVRL